MGKAGRWKRAAGVLLSFFLLLQVAPIEVFATEYWPEAPEVVSPSVILMEMSTGTVLYEKNSTEKNYPASITKIMTAMIALEHSELNEVVTFSDEAINNTEGSGIARDYGEEMTMEECLYAVLLASANECAYAVAEHVGGTVDRFVEMMNAKAAELGCKNTHFANPHGLFDENHYTSCYDMALIARAAYQNETFRIITGTARYTIPPTNKHKEPTELLNHNEMLYPWQTLQWRYDYCTGGKTGYTAVARSTLVTYAEKDGMSLVCVVMHTESPGQWQDSTQLFDYAFDNFQVFNIADNETKYDSSEAVEVGALNGNRSFVDLDQEAKVVLPKTTEFSDAVSEIVYDDVSNDVVGSIVYTYADREVGRADIIRTGIEVQGFLFEDEQDAVEEEKVSTVQIRPMNVLLVVAGIVFLSLLAFFIKRLADNYYIIRHNMEVRRSQRKQFREIRNRQNRHRRRRR